MLSAKATFVICAGLGVHVHYKFEARGRLI